LRANPRSKIKKIIRINGIWRRECQSILIERSSIFDLSRLKPTVSATAGKCDFVYRTRPVPFEPRTPLPHAWRVTTSVSSRSWLVQVLATLFLRLPRHVAIARFRKGTYAREAKVLAGYAGVYRHESGRAPSRRAAAVIAGPSRFTRGLQSRSANCA
jgi:hypothetical protein